MVLKKAVPETGQGNVFTVTDIRRGGFESSKIIVDQLRKGLNPTKGKEKTMPTLLLYDQKGLRLFEEIMELEEYYLTESEIEVLKHHANKIAETIRPGSMIVELGSGNLDKVKHLLRAIEKTEKKVDYYALDLSEPELQRTLSAVETDFKFVRCHGLLGTYDDGLEWLKKPEQTGKSKCILWLGSSIGNLNHSEAKIFLGNFSSLMGPDDSMLIGIDACQDKAKVTRAYNDEKGTTHAFILNGLCHANSLIGRTVFQPDDWCVIGKYNAEKHCHQAFYVPQKDVDFEGILIRSGERIRVEESYKYDQAQRDELWKAAGLTLRTNFANGLGDYHLHDVSLPNASPLKPHDLKFDSLPEPFPSDPTVFASTSVPSYEEWQKLEEFWEVLTRYMIPGFALPEKPINLRNPFGFYLGHIHAQTDIFLTKAITRQASSHPSYFHTIFERGIDPDVKTGEIHPHSDYPEDDPPPLERVLAFVAEVRDRIKSFYNDGFFIGEKAVGIALWLSFEHQAMHLETLLYMHLMSESRNLRPPPGKKPDFEALAMNAEAIAKPDWDQKWANVPAYSFDMGVDKPDVSGYNAIDNEMPKRKAIVPAFQVMPRPLTNSDYAHYLESRGKKELPASWVAQGLDDSNRREPDFREGKSVRTPYGLVPLKHALHWPVAASYEDLNACAEWFGGRIPTAEEVQAIYRYVDAETKKRKAEEAQANYSHTDTDKKNGKLSILTRRISGVNGHLSNGGVEISPPSQTEHTGASGVEKGPNPNQYFSDLEDCNVGFKHWHPMPVTSEGSRLLGRGQTGGVWEWTSSVLRMHEGFVPMEIYPEYTVDFCKGEHNVVLGGSWATHPRIAGRKSFVNFFQRTYQFAWCGARVVRDSSK